MANSDVFLKEKCQLKVGASQDSCRPNHVSISDFFLDVRSRRIMTCSESLLELMPLS